ncbi:hypothetical protein BJ138DRAFT_394316 [Hygrophoropsis aurantiaca]|uniref:Uncharacterized protein n=1 Tax=Hygrophoropsis aurantiaca TaxID=72124 RepID=A0ACB8A4X9_9AGAM|nr:hypothetical protein BJ138DRAFT_394316 [Hygrophoropsis aurantiaca]
MSDAVIVASRAQISTYIRLSMIAVVAFDYCVTFNTEVIWIWGTSWNYIRVLYVLAHYLPFGLMLPLLFIELQRQLLSMGAAEALLLIRTCVLWGKSRIVLIGLIILSLVSFVVAVFPYNPPSYVWDFVGLAFFELVILVLHIVQMFHHDRRSRIFLLMRDDIFYVLCILGMSVVNIILINAVNDYANLSIALQVVLHSVMSSRLLFSLRQIMHQQHIMGSNVGITQSSSGTEMLSMAFARNPTNSPGVTDTGDCNDSEVALHGQGTLSR